MTAPWRWAFGTKRSRTKILTIIVVIAFVFTIFSAISSPFGSGYQLQSANLALDPAYTVSIAPNSSIYYGAQKIGISGTVSPAPTTSAEIAITVKNPSGTIVDVASSTVKVVTGVFYDNFTAGGTVSWVNGTYSITAEYATSLSGPNYYGNSSFVYDTMTPYAVVFTETGLPTGTAWYLNITGQSSLSSTTTTIKTALPNSTYFYSIASSNKKYAPETAFPGSFTVTGSPVSETIPFALVTYNITFTESGLASGTTWSVTLNGSSNSSATTSIGFLEPNGSYNFAVSAVVGYVASPSNGSVLVSGSTVTQNIAFSKLYNVSFNETGLPPGTKWYVNITGQSSLSSTTPFINTTLPNGTYTYYVASSNKTYYLDRVGALFEWFNVTGSSALVNVSFIVYKAEVNFFETGLPSGINWYVEIPAGSKPSYVNGSGIIMFLVNGTYNYTVGLNDTRWTPSPSTGTFKVAGTLVNIFITFSLVTYPVTFTESGLPPGTSWSVTLNGSPSSSISSSIEFNESNGTYPYTVGVVSGYEGSPSTGNVTVEGSGVTTNIVFSKAYSVTFNETGLPSGTKWYLNISGQPSLNSTTGTIKAFFINGTYNYVIASSNTSYSLGLGLGHGSFTVAGSPLWNTVTFQLVTYNVFFTESGLPTSTSWSVTLNGSPSSSISSSIEFNESNGTYAFSVGVVPGYVASPSTGNVTVSGLQPFPVTINFTVKTYNVTFNETEKPFTVLWWVNVTNSTGPVSASNSIFTSILFSLPNGTYNYTVASADKRWSPSPGSGQFEINGANVSVSVTFSLVTYNVTFIETGLPSGTLWNVTFNVSSNSSTSSSIGFTAPNGTYSFGVNLVTGYVSSPPGGRLTVSGSAVTQNITFYKLYLVTFNETGLPSGTYWYVNVTNSTGGTDSFTVYGLASISFEEPNGTYNYTIASANKSWSPSPSSGTFTVSGSKTWIDITFSLVTYNVTFTETGLPSGTEWYLNLTNQSFSSSTTSITFAEPNGTYSYTLSSNNSAYHAQSGSFTVNGAAVTVTVTFSSSHVAKEYTDTFKETGLPSGTTWGVTIDGVVHTTSSSSITLTLPEGEYVYSIDLPPGYVASPSSGTLSVTDESVTVYITFKVISTSAPDGYLTGSLTPSNASLYINGMLYPTNDGRFNVSLSPGTYQVEIMATGYSTVETNVTVGPSSVSVLPIHTLKKAPDWTTNAIVVSLMILIIVVASLLAVLTVTVLRVRRKVG